MNWRILLVLYTLALGCKHASSKVNNSVQQYSLKDSTHNYELLNSDTIPAISQSSIISLVDSSNPRNYLVKVRADKANRSEFNYIDLRKINPYRNMGYPFIYMAEDSVDFSYDLSSISDFRLNTLMGQVRINSDVELSKGSLTAYVKPPVAVIKVNTLAIAYSIHYYTNNDDLIGAQGEAIIIAANDEDIVRISDNSNGFYDIRLSYDGSLLMQKYGTNYGEDGGGQTIHGLKIYSIKSGALKFSFEFGRTDNLVNYGFIEDLPNFATALLKANGFEYFVFDIKNNTLYKYSGTMEEWTNQSRMRLLLSGFLQAGDVDQLTMSGFETILLDN